MEDKNNTEKKELTLEEFINDSKNNGLTDEENEILFHTVQAWNKYLKLDVQLTTDRTDFAFSVRQLQHLLMIRGIRRMNPNRWKIDKI